MNAQAIDWSDIPYILAVCRHGSLSGAARHLGVNHSTVFRRIEQVEERLGVRLFDRLPQGYIMTAAGAHFLDLADNLDEGVIRLQRELGGQDLRLTGNLRITTTDSLIYCLAPVFTAFQRRYPDITLEINTSVLHMDLSKRDADIAIRPTAQPPEHWVGRQLTPLSSALYASHDYWETHQHLPPDEQTWLGVDDAMRQSPMSKLLSTHMPEPGRVTTANTVLGVFGLLRAGIGIGALPCYLGEQAEDLIRLPFAPQGRAMQVDRRPARCSASCRSPAKARLICLAQPWWVNFAVWKAIKYVAPSSRAMDP